MIWFSLVVSLFLFGFVAIGVFTSGASMNRRRRLSRQIGVLLFYAPILNFLFFWHINVAIGGDALSGRVRNGRYYVASHGKFTEVSERLYRFSYAHEVSTWLTLPISVLGWCLAFQSEQKPAKSKKQDWSDELTDANEICTTKTL